MNKESLLNKLSSKYLIDIITSYIDDENFLYKLFIYSKFFQKKLNIESLDYKNKYFTTVLESNKNIFFDQKDKTKENFETFLINYNINRFDLAKIAVDYFKTRKKYEERKKISFDCPIFDALSKIENFDNIFSISINLNDSIYDNKDFFNSYFDKLKNSNIKFSSLVFYFKKIKYLNAITDFNINFKQIKQLDILKPDSEHYQCRNVEDYEYFFKNFPFNEVQNNLLNLKMDLLSYDRYMNNNYFPKMNDLKSLINLELKRFKFGAPFEFKLCNLKSLSLEECQNISFDENIFLKLNKLDIINCENIQSKSKLKCPELQHCSIYNISQSLDFNSILDFSSIIKLKSFEGNSTHFLLLESEYLEKVSLKNDYTDLMEKDCMEKFISTKTLKEISFYWLGLSDAEISGIVGENPSVKKMTIRTTFKDCFTLQKKFPNLISIDIDYLDDRFIYKNDQEGLEIGIIPDPKSQIKDILIVKGNKCYCQSYEKLESIEIHTYGKAIGLDNFPILNDNCNIILNKLISFHLWISDKEEGPKYLLPLAKNINKMPNLRDIKILMYYDYEDFGEEDFKQFIKDILTKKHIKKISIQLRSESKYFEYPLGLLKEYFPDINFTKFEKVFVVKCEEPENKSHKRKKRKEIPSKSKIKIPSKLKKCNIF